MQRRRKKVMMLANAKGCSVSYPKTMLFAGGMLANIEEDEGKYYK